MTVKMAKRDQIPAVHDTFVHKLLTKPCNFFLYFILIFSFFKYQI